MSKNDLPFHVEFLRSDFEKRCQKNALYSLRAHSARLGVHPSALSRIFSGKQKLAPSAAIKIFKNLEISSADLQACVQSMVDESRESLTQKFEKAFGVKM